MIPDTSGDRDLLYNVKVISHTSLIKLRNLFDTVFMHNAVFVMSARYQKFNCPDQFRPICVIISLDRVKEFFR